MKRCMPIISVLMVINAAGCGKGLVEDRNTGGSMVSTDPDPATDASNNLDPGAETRCPGNSCDEPNQSLCTDDNKTLTCINKTWMAHQCMTWDGEICVEGKCVRKGSGCPTRVEYNGSIGTHETFDPVAITGCFTGGDIGRNVSYSDESADRRYRSVSINWISGGCTKDGFITSGINLSAVFGLDISAAVSSADSELSGHIYPNIVDQATGKTVYHYAKFFRQTLRIERVATLWQGDKFVGTATLTDWMLNLDLATGESFDPPNQINGCPVKTNLPEAQTYNQPTCLTTQDGCQCSASPAP